jgi:hypothetical protein
LPKRSSRSTVGPDRTGETHSIWLTCPAFSLLAGRRSR